MVQIINGINLIGDLVGTVPLMIDLARIHGGLEVYQTLDEGKWIYPMLEKHNIQLVNNVEEGTPELDIERAFKFGCENELYMSSCWHEQFELPPPNPPPRPELDFEEVYVPVYDYIFAPFSRSTPEEQKWQKENWFKLGQELNLQGYSVCAFGNSKHDDMFYFEGGIYGAPVSQSKLPYTQFDRPLTEVLNMIKKCRRGVVSINTGISHLCFATNTKNYLLNNQGRGWAVQPDAISIETYIPRITVTEMLDFIKNN